MRKPLVEFLIEEENLIAVISESEFLSKVYFNASRPDRVVVFAVRSHRGHYLAWYNGYSWVKLQGESF